MTEYTVRIRNPFLSRLWAFLFVLCAINAPRYGFMTGHPASGLVLIPIFLAVAFPGKTLSAVAFCLSWTYAALQRAWR